MKCVIYLRVSDDKQVAGASLGDQERACRTFAEREGLTVVRVYRDEGRSAYKDELRYRPEFERLLAAGKGRLFGAVVVYKLDRFARKARVYHNARWQLEQAGVRLFSATEPNEANAAGRLSSAMLADFAEFYSAQLSERIKTAHAGKVERREWIGDVPFGYVRSGRSLAPGPLQLWVVLIFVAYDLGATTVQIASSLNAAGVPLRSGKPWTKDSVLMVLHNRAYIGRGGGRAVAEYESGHQPLITVDLWTRAHQRLVERRRGAVGPRQYQRAPPRAYEALCALCGGKMQRYPNTTQVYLRCRGSVNKTCEAKGVRFDLVEHQVDLLKQNGACITRIWVRAPRGVERFE